MLENNLEKQLVQRSHVDCVKNEALFLTSESLKKLERLATVEVSSYFTLPCLDTFHNNYLDDFNLVLLVFGLDDFNVIFRKSQIFFHTLPLLSDPFGTRPRRHILIGSVIQACGDARAKRILGAVRFVLVERHRRYTSRVRVQGWCDSCSSGCNATQNCPKLHE